MNDEHQTYKEQGCDDEPPSEEIVEESSGERDRHDHEHPSKSMFQQWRELKIDRRIESSVAVLGLIIGIVVACIALNQLNAMRDQTKAMQGQLDEMKKGSADTKTIAESAKTQADSTKKLAEATESMAEATRSSVAQSKASLDATIEMGHMDQRAWVAMKQMNATFKDDTTIKVSITFVNSGKTAAFNVNLGVGPFIRPPGIMTGTDERITRFNHPVIFPAGPPSVEILGISSSREEVDAVKTGKKVLLVVGEIEYRDVFRKPHITEFCGIYGPKDGLFYACNEHQRAT